MNDDKQLKIKYNYAVHLTLMLMIFGVLSNLILDFLIKIIPYLKSRSIIQILEYIFPFLFLFVYIYNKNYGGLIQRNTLWRELGWNVYISAFYLTILTILLNEYVISIMLNESFFLEPFYNFFNIDFKERLAYPITFFITVVLLAPCCEEFLFRGILLNGLLRQNISPVKAILFSSFLFGCVHMNPWQFVSAFITGSLIGLIYFRTRSLLLCILLHALNNGLGYFVIFFDKEERFYSWIISHNPILWIVIISLAVVLRLFVFQTKSYCNR